MAGRNRAKPKASYESYSFSKSHSSDSEDKPCIFLSHISVDKEKVEEIANYIMDRADIDVYLDIYDDELQTAVKLKEPHAITSLIERGISNSTHAMCLISDKTVDSWWVPYELGYAKKSGKKISSLRLKGNVELPDYLKIGDTLKGIKSLNSYIEEVIKDFEAKNVFSKMNESLVSYVAQSHPLENILDWQN